MPDDTMTPAEQQALTHMVATHTLSRVCAELARIAEERAQLILRSPQGEWQAARIEAWRAAAARFRTIATVYGGL